MMIIVLFNFNYFLYLKNQSKYFSQNFHLKVHTCTRIYLHHSYLFTGFPNYFVNFKQIQGFKLKGGLKQHTFLHTGQRPYRCQYCLKVIIVGFSKCVLETSYINFTLQCFSHKGNMNKHEKLRCPRRPT